MAIGAVTEEVVAITFEITVKAEIADALILAARARDRSPASIMAEIMETVLVDGLIDAVLDDAT